MINLSQFCTKYEGDGAHLLPRHDGVLGHHVGHPPPVDPQRVGAASVIEQNLGGTEDVYVVYMLLLRLTMLG